MIGSLRNISNTQLSNAKFVYEFFRSRGWTSESISGMLGNMQAESGVIADIDERSGGGGYGLVQWTPKSKLTDWAAKKDLDHRTLEAQCKRIQWELENTVQFYSTAKFPMTFKEFSRSTESPAHLARVFMHNYERPANLNQPARGDYASDWFELLVVRGGNPGSSGDTTPTTPSDTYTVVKGDTLSAIARKFNTSVATLQELNNIKDANKISVGQVLRLPSGAAGSVQNPPATNPATYTVVKGDTLSAIALRFGTTVAVLQSLNNIKDANKISIGQVLKLPSGATSSAPSTYTVVKGDTLSAIA